MSTLSSPTAGEGGGFLKEAVSLVPRVYQATNRASAYGWVNRSDFVQVFCMVNFHQSFSYLVIVTYNYHA